MTKGTYRRKYLFGAYSSRGIKIHHHYGGVYDYRQAGMQLEKHLTSSRQHPERGSREYTGDGKRL